MSGFFCGLIVALTLIATVYGQDEAVHHSPNTVRTDQKCGDNVYWSLSDGTLRIYGEGKMSDYSQTRHPSWYSESSLIEKVVIENDVTSVGKYAFYSLSSMTSVTLPDSLRTIGDYAFCYCKKIKELSIPPYLETIGSCAFYDCRGLIRLAIPASLAHIGNNAFIGCVNLTSFDVDEGNPNYASKDECLFDKNYTTLIQYPLGKEDEAYSVPDYVTLLESGAFEEAKLVSVTIPNGVIIGDYCFAFSLNLKNVFIGDGLTSIGSSTFLGCTSLTHVRLPETLQTIEQHAFDGCSSLEFLKFPNSLQSIRKYAFVGAGLVSLVIPEAVSEMGESAFDCRSLTSVFYLGDKEDFLTCNAFEGNPRLIDVCVSPDYTQQAFCGKNVTLDNGKCKQFSGFFNRCYKAGYSDDGFFSEKRSNATEWENRTCACKKFYCDNETGPVAEDGCNETIKPCYVGYCNETSGECAYRQTAEWQELVKQENHCYEVVCDGNNWTVQKRENATEWEKQTTNCVQYICFNKSGGGATNFCESSSAPGGAVSKSQSVHTMVKGFILMFFIILFELTF